MRLKDLGMRGEIPGQQMLDALVRHLQERNECT